jgi:hypothetical protein
MKNSKMMAEQNIYDYFTTHTDGRFVLSFKGTISQSVLVGLAEIVENKIAANNRPQTVIKKVFAITIELSQNVLHHSFNKSLVANKDTRAGDGIVVISEDETAYRITSGNMIDNGNIPQMNDRCRQLQELDRPGLKALYKTQRQRKTDHSAQTPGLGLIDIACRSDRPIEMTVTPVDGNKSFMALSATVNKG